MESTLLTAPTVEPVSLAELKLHMRLDSGTFADALTETQSLKPDNWTVATHNGTGVDVLGYDTVVVLNAGTCGGGGTVDVKIQESDDDGVTDPYTDWGTAFAQVTTANDERVYEKAYTGSKRYIRVVAVVGTAACDFSVLVCTFAPTSAEDTLLTVLIQGARTHVEQRLGRALITQTWKLYPDDWPAGGFINLMWPPLQSVTHVKYTDYALAVTTMVKDTDYHEDTDTLPPRIVLPYGGTWPTATLHVVTPIEIQVVCGYGDAATDVPADIVAAVKLLAAHLYENREAVVMGAGGFGATRLPMGVEALLAPYRVYDFGDL